MKSLIMKTTSTLIFSLLMTVVCIGGLYLLPSSAIKAAEIHRAPADIRKDIAQEQDELTRLMKEDLDIKTLETTKKNNELKESKESIKAKLNEATTKKATTEEEKTKINDNLIKLKELKEKEDLAAVNTSKMNLENEIKALEEKLKTTASENDKTTINNDLELKKKEIKDKEKNIIMLKIKYAYAGNIDLLEGLNNEIKEAENNLQKYTEEIANLTAEITNFNTEISNITAEIEKNVQDTVGYVTGKTDPIEAKIMALDKELVAAEQAEQEIKDTNKAKTVNETIVGSEDPKEKPEKQEKKLPQTGGYETLLAGMVLIGLGTSLITLRKLKKI